MAKIDALRRFLLPCFSPATTGTKSTTVAASSTTGTKKRISTSLRDDIQDHKEVSKDTHKVDQEDEDSSPTSSENESRNYSSTTTPVPSRPSKTMVIGTIFGHRRTHVWFCIQHDRHNTRPTLLLELSISTFQLVKEMQCGLVRIALECNRSELSSCPLHNIPVWTMFCNGRKIGFAATRKSNEEVRLMLKTMQNTTVGAGVIPSEFGSSDGDTELMYMRANYECMVGGADSESFHLINPGDCSGQEFSLFLLRSR